MLSILKQIKMIKDKFYLIKCREKGELWIHGSESRGKSNETYQIQLKTGFVVIRLLSLLLLLFLFFIIIIIVVTFIIVIIIIRFVIIRLIVLYLIFNHQEMEKSDLVMSFYLTMAYLKI